MLDDVRIVCAETDCYQVFPDPVLKVEQMPIVVQCDVCGKKFRVGDQYEGTSIPCKKCGAEMFAFSSAATGQILTRGGSTSTMPTYGDEPDEGMPPWVMKLSIGAGVVVLLLIVGLIISGVNSGGGSSGTTITSNDNGSSPPSAPSVATPPGIGTQPNGFNSRPVPQVRNSSGNSATSDDSDTSASPEKSAETSEENLLETAMRDLFGEIAEPGQRGVPTYDNSPPTLWRVDVDPPPAELVYDFDTPLKRLSVSIDTFASDVVYFPETFSPYFAVSGEEQEIYDLRSGRRRKKAEFEKEFNTKLMLSPDAGYIAAPKGPFGSAGVAVWDVTEQKTIPGLNSSEMKQVCFASENRLVGIRETEILVWDVPQSKIVGNIETPGLFRSKADIAISPGGRYLCAARLESSIDGSLTIPVFDLNSFAKIGTLRVPGQKGLLGADLEGVGFSPDGTKLAALVTTREQARLVIWDFERGTVEKDFTLKENYEHLHDASWRASNNKFKAVQWFPNNERLLILGHGVVDTVVGEIMYLFPAAQGGISHRWPINNSQVLAVVGDVRRTTLTTLDLPIEMFDKAREIILNGGYAIDTTLPDLTKAKLAGMTTPLEPGSEWQVQPDPAPAPVEGLLAKPLEFQLPTEEGYFSQLLMSGAAGGRVAIARKTRENRFRFYGEPIEFTAWIDTYDLVRGKSVGKPLELSYPADAISFSGSGKYIATRDAERQNRLDLWNVDDNAHYLGFRPYIDLPIPKHTGRQLSEYGEYISSDQRILACRFIDDEHLITLNGNKRLRGWKLPECQATYEIEQVDIPGVSPGGKYLIVHADDKLRIYDARTGEPLSALEAEGEISAAAFHTNGELLAITVLRGADNYLYVWNLSSGELVSQFPLPIQNEQLRFADTQNLLLDGDQLVNLERKAVAWNYQFPDEAVIPHNLDDRVVYYGPRYGRKPAIYMTAVKLPEQPTIEKIDSSRLSSEFVPLKDKNVALQMAVAEPPKTKNYSGDVKAHYIDKLKEIGAVPARQGRFQLVVQTQETAGRSLTFRDTFSDPFSGGGIGPSLFRQPQAETQTANMRNIECSLAILEDGAPVWRYARTSSNYSPFVMLQKGSSLQQALDSGLWGSVKHFFETSPLPTFVFPPGADQGLGQTEIAPEGLRQQ